MKTKNKKMIIGLSVVIAIIVLAGIFTIGYLKGRSGSGSGTSEGAVQFSRKSGAYDNEFNLKLKAEDAIIYYTTDGSDPSTSETRVEYKNPVSIKERSSDVNVVSAVDPILFDAVNTNWDEEKQEYVSTVPVPEDEKVDKITVIKAIAQDKDGNCSPVQTHSYFIGSMADHIDGIRESCQAAGLDLSVMSISMDYDDLFDSEKGIYVKGDIFDKALTDYLKKKDISGWGATEIGRGLDANYKQRGKSWERPAHIDYFESDGEETSCKLQQDCGIRIQGNYSRSDLQKGLRLSAGQQYGTKNFEYAFFGDASQNDQGEPVSKFKKLTLRNGGNCAFTAKFNDTYWQSLIANLNCETQASRVCVVYLNGEYWGVYILQEDYNDNYFQEKHGVDDKAVVAYKGDAETYKIGYKLDEGEIPLGEDDSYYFKDLLDFYKKHKDLKSKKDYAEFEKLVDVESVRDYFAVNIWVNNKWDWPGKNWTAWKVTQPDSSNPYADGRWRLCFYDMDFGGVSGISDASVNTIKEDNYEPNGLLDMNTKNPVVLMYAYLMTNDEFRKDFSDKLNELTEKTLESESAIATCGVYKDTYEPLLSQFFARYMGEEEAQGMVENAMNGNYASYSCIVDFLVERKNHIQDMQDWVDDYYSKNK